MSILFYEEANDTQGTTPCCFRITTHISGRSIFEGRVVVLTAAPFCFKSAAGASKTAQ